jgi:hypothetical protein
VLRQLNASISDGEMVAPRSLAEERDPGLEIHAEDEALY